VGHRVTLRNGKGGKYTVQVKRGKTKKFSINFRSSKGTGSLRGGDTYHKLKGRLDITRCFPRKPNPLSFVGEAEK